MELGRELYTQYKLGRGEERTVAYQHLQVTYISMKVGFKSYFLTVNVVINEVSSSFWTRRNFPHGNVGLVLYVLGKNLGVIFSISSCSHQQMHVLQFIRNSIQQLLFYITIYFIQDNFILFANEIYLFIHIGNEMK